MEYFSFFLGCVYVFICLSVCLYVQEIKSNVSVHAKSLQLCPTLCDAMDCSPPGSSAHEILQAWTLEWVTVPFSRGSSKPRNQTQVYHISGKFFTAEPTGKPQLWLHWSPKSCFFLPPCWWSCYYFYLWIDSNVDTLLKAKFNMCKTEIMWKTDFPASSL